MKLILENFRCYTNYTFECNDVGNILLNGKSGAGKSTIFKAINFVLYGKEQKVIQYGKKKCKVTFYFQNLILSRSKNPNTLTVIKDSNTYSEISAQEIINKIFGYHFNLTGYVAQKNIESFFQLSKDQKTAFLQQLAIDDYPIDILKENVKNEYKKEKEYLLQITSKIQALQLLEKNYTITTQPSLSNEFFSFFNITNTNINYIEIKQIINNIENETNDNYKKIELELDNLQLKYNTILSDNFNKKTYLNLKDESEQKCKTFATKNNLEIYTTSQINLCKEKCDLLLNEKKNANLYQDYIKKVDHYNSLIKDYNNEVNELENKCNTFSVLIPLETLYHYKKYLEKFNCKTIQDLNNLYHKNIVLLKDCNENISKLEEQKTKDTIFNIEVNKHIQQLQSGKHLECPNCNSTLLYIENKLISQDTSNIEEQIKKLKNSLKIIDMTELLTLQNKNKIYNENIKSLVSFSNLSDEIVSYSLKDVNKFIENHTEYTKYKSQKDLTINKFKKCKDEFNQLKSIEKTRNILEIEKEYNLYHEYKSLLEEWKKYEIKYKDILEKYNEDENIELNIKKEYLNKKEKYKELQEYTKLVLEYKNEYQIFFNINEQYNQYTIFINELTILKETENKVRKRCTNLDLFLSKIMLSESQTLESIIDTINIQLDILMEHFFHSNLTMYLTSTKTTTGGDKKFYTDILFIDKDGNHITIDNLSGGEYDRCALALFLTFNKLSKTPILLLDEALSSLHSESVNDIVDTIKECIQPKTVLITLHQCNTGIFDQVINVENLTSIGVKK